MSHFRYYLDSPHRRARRLLFGRNLFIPESLPGEIEFPIVLWVESWVSHFRYYLDSPHRRARRLLFESLPGEIEFPSVLLGRKLGESFLVLH